MDIQNRIVFTVELEFTFASLVPEAPATCFYHAFFFRPLPLFRQAWFVPESTLSMISASTIGAARLYPAHTWLDAVPKPK